ncbi:MAG: ABC transporter ATP-binding protein [Planctomycetes bacterium]|nr:ABC transporter ATP-binding protein [Planctomycetota bacterium]
MSFLQLQQLKKTFADGTEAVKGVDLSIDEGEFIVLLGPSGCGKTTTLRMVAGLEAPSDGRVIIAGQDVTRLRPAQRDVGFVFQFYALYPHMTVEQNIAFTLESTGAARRECRERVADVSRVMGLGALLRRYPRQLSGGDQQRVALARAVVRRPKVYLMDEPLGTLDADKRLEMREFIRSRQQEMKVTTIYVTHDQEEAMSLADRVVVMHEGMICQAGPPTEVYDDPASLFVARFVGSPGMNFIPGSVVADDGQRFFVPHQSQARMPLGRDVRPGPVTLGVRPEYVYPSSDGPIAGSVVMDEYQGNFRSIHIDTGFAHNLVMRAGDADARAVGESIRLSFNAEHTRFFDGNTGQRL